MKLLNAALVALGIFAILRFPILTFAKSAWEKHNLVTKRKKGFWIAVIEEAGKVALTAALTFLALAGLLLYIDAQGGSSIEKLTYALDRLDSFREPLKTVNAIWGGWLMFFSLAVFTWLWFRTGKKHFAEKFARQTREQYDELQRTLAERPSEWEKLEPTPVMKAVLAQIQRALAELEALRPGEPNYEFRKPKLEDTRDRLAGLLVQLDFERRIKISWDIDSPEPTTRWGRVRAKFLSKGFLTDMKMVGKTFKYAVLALTFAGLVGIESPLIAQAVTSKIARLDEIAVSRSREETRKNREAAEKQAGQEVPPQHDPQPPPSTPPPTPAPTPQQIQALRAFAHDAVHSFAGNPIWE